MSEHQLASAAIVGASFLVAATIKNAYDTTGVLRDLEIKTNQNLLNNAEKTADAVLASGMADAEMTRNDAIIAGVNAGCSGLNVVALGSGLGKPKEEQEVNGLDNLTRLKPAAASQESVEDGSVGSSNQLVQDQAKAALSTSRGLDADGNLLVPGKKYVTDNGKLKISTDDTGHTPEEIYGESSGDQRNAFMKGVNKEKDVRTTALSSASQSRMNVINSLTEMAKNITNSGGQIASSIVRGEKAAIDRSQSLYNNAQELLRPVDQKLSQELDAANADAKQATRALLEQINNLNPRG